MAKLTAELLAGRLELAPLPAHAARPGVLAEGVDHRTPDATFRERLELDASRFVEAMRRVNQTDDAVLDEVPDVDGMGHRGGDATGKLLNERKTGCDARVDRYRALALGAHECDLRRQVRQRRYQLVESTGIAVQPRARATPKWLFLQTLKATKVAVSAHGLYREFGQIANRLTEVEPPDANILTLQLQF